MKPVRVWVGMVFLALGVLAFLDATGTLAWDRTVEEWWPVAIVGWGLAEMLADRRVSLGGSIIAAIGVTLLADEQEWAVEAAMWGALFAFVGLAILFAPRAKDEVDRPEGSSVAGATQT